MLNYQDALFESAVAEGERDCEARWELVAPHVPSRGMILDVGSNLGYFGIRAVLENKGVAVVSLESDPQIVAKQRDIAASRRLDRICILHGNFGARVSCEWVKTCDWFELTFLFCVLHWFDDPAAVLRDLSKMSARILVELPDADDAGARGQEKLKAWKDPLAWLRSVTGRRCSHLGRIERHTSDVPSHMILVEGPIERRPSLAYWHSVYEHPEGTDYHIAFDGRSTTLSIRGRTRHYVPGVNLVSLMKLGGLLWPKPEHWIRLGSRAIHDLPRHLDPLPHNMLWTPSGLRLIDEADVRGDAHGRAAKRILRKHVRAWARNKTAAEDAYSPRTTHRLSKMKKRILRIVRKGLPDPLVTRIKASFVYKRLQNR